MEYHIKRTDGTDKDFISLTDMLDREFRHVDEKAFNELSRYNNISTVKYAVVAYIENTPVACGAIRHYENVIIEVKRMFVLPDIRGKGIASYILQELEKWGRELGYEIAILETGRILASAIRLYEKLGYSIIPNYGQYENVPTSICFKKDLL